MDTSSWGPKWAWLVGAAVIVFAVVAVVLIRTHQPGPSAAAEDWGNAYLDGDKKTAHELGCDELNYAGGDLAFQNLYGGAPDELEATEQHPDGKGGWTVRLQWTNDDGQTHDMTVNVTESDGEYQVC